MRRALGQGNIRQALGDDPAPARDDRAAEATCDDLKFCADALPRRIDGPALAGAVNAGGRMAAQQAGGFPCCRLGDENYVINNWEKWNNEETVQKNGFRIEKQRLPRSWKDATSIYMSIL
ncbi:hypothetical protein [Azospirillum brasilense]|uniref:hypothetical protein n=1 Tax=Azospirillum brasilense TaxID=192 RepID=UPI0010C024FA|nr:hypothetical protein [Azospirillum brasilense]